MYNIIHIYKTLLVFDDFFRNHRPYLTVTVCKYYTLIVLLNIVSGDRANKCSSFLQLHTFVIINIIWIYNKSLNLKIKKIYIYRMM